ncbi:MAG TPA: hypothetical protein VF079_11370, partial [Sphingomicrobium sp.]
MATTFAEGQPHLTPKRRSKRAERVFFTGMAAATLLTVFAGFAPTYFLQSSLGAAVGVEPRVFTPLVHLHALVFSAWILLFMTQASLVATGRTVWHRKIGPVSLIVALAVAV